MRYVIIPEQFPVAAIRAMAKAHGYVVRETAMGTLILSRASGLGGFLCRATNVIPFPRPRPVRKPEFGGPDTAA
jgi:hypothetical protein